MKQFAVSPSISFGKVMVYTNVALKVVPLR